MRRNLKYHCVIDDKKGWLRQPIDHAVKIVAEAKRYNIYSVKGCRDQHRLYEGRRLLAAQPAKEVSMSGVDQDSSLGTIEDALAIYWSTG